MGNVNSILFIDICDNFISQVESTNHDSSKLDFFKKKKAEHTLTIQSHGGKKYFQILGASMKHFTIICCNTSHPGSEFGKQDSSMVSFISLVTVVKRNRLLDGQTC